MTEETPAVEVAEQEAAPEADAKAANYQATTEAEDRAGDEESEETNELDDLLKQATGATANPEAVEVEYDGKKYQVAPELKDALLRQADYTKKTMEVADTRKAIEATKAEVEQLASVSKDELQAVISAQLAHAKVEALLATPIDGLTQDQINALRLDLADAQQATAQHVAKAQEAANTAKESRSQHYAKAVETARTEAAKHIPNFDDAKIAAFGSLVESLGGEPDAVKQADHPAVYRVLHLAHIGQQFIERQRQAGKAKAAQEVQPATEVGTKSSPPRGLSDNLSPEEWNRRRNEQLRKK